MVAIILATITGILQQNWLLGFLLGAGAIFGDAVFGAFVKRRFGLPRGAPAPLLDQLDFVVGALLAASFVVSISLTTVLVLVIFTPLAHLAVNMIGYKVGLKREPW